MSSRCTIMFILRIPNISICHYYRTKIMLPKNRWIFLQDSLQSRLILAFTFRSMIYKKSPQKIGGFYGGAKRDRTADLYNAIVALSQLSYGPFFNRQVSTYLLQLPNRLLTLLHPPNLLGCPKYLRHQERLQPLLHHQLRRQEGYHQRHPLHRPL